MADTFNKTSFIPQKSLTPKTAKKKKPIGLVFMIAVILFVISIAGVAGTLAYREFLKGGIESKALSLERAREAFDPGLIEDLTRLNQRLESAKSVLKSHIALTPFLELLESSTLKNVRFDEMSLLIRDQDEISLTIDGEAVDYATVVLQSDLFGESRFLREQIFSDINLDESGNVGFTLEAKVDPDILSFDSNLVEI